MRHSNDLTTYVLNPADWPAPSRWVDRGWCPLCWPGCWPRLSPPGRGSGSAPCSSPTTGTWRPRSPPAPGRGPRCPETLGHQGGTNSSGQNEKLCNRDVRWREIKYGTWYDLFCSQNPGTRLKIWNKVAAANFSRNFTPRGWIQSRLWEDRTRVSLLLDKVKFVVREKENSCFRNYVLVTKIESESCKDQMDLSEERDDVFFL